MATLRRSDLVVRLRAIDLVHVQALEALSRRDGGRVVREEAALLRRIRRYYASVRLHLAMLLLFRIRLDRLLEHALSRYLALVVHEPLNICAIFVNSKACLMRRLVDVLGGVVCFCVQLVHRVRWLHHRNTLQDRLLETRLVLLFVGIALLKMRWRYHLLLQIDLIDVSILEFAVPWEVR